MTQKIDELEALFTPAIDALGLGVAIWGIEFQAGTSSALLRIYIDASERPVTIEDCEAVSREISALLDVNDPIDGNYTLEVSSPGLDRPLFTLDHYRRYVGHEARIALALPQDGRRRITGRIRAIEGDTIQVDADGIDIAVAFANIAKAKLQPQFGPPPKPGKPEGKPRKPAGKRGRGRAKS